MMCNIAGEEEAIKKFESGVDFHTMTARMMLEIPDDVELTRDQRQIGKVLNFGISYGMTIPTIAKKTNHTEDEAKQLYDKYFAALPKLQQLIAWAQDQVRDTCEFRQLPIPCLALQNPLDCLRFELFCKISPRLNTCKNGGKDSSYPFLLFRGGGSNDNRIGDGPPVSVFPPRLERPRRKRNFTSARYQTQTRNIRHERSPNLSTLFQGGVFPREKEILLFPRRGTQRKTTHSVSLSRIFAADPLKNQQVVLSQSHNNKDSAHRRSAPTVEQHIPHTLHCRTKTSRVS